MDLNVEPSIYEENGYEDRKDYLDSLAEEYCVPKEDVYLLASFLGKEEDFDGLVSMVQDMTP